VIDYKRCFWTGADLFTNRVMLETKFTILWFWKWASIAFGENPKVSLCAHASRIKKRFTRITLLTGGCRRFFSRPFVLAVKWASTFECGRPAIVPLHFNQFQMRAARITREIDPLAKWETPFQMPKFLSQKRYSANTGNYIPFRICRERNWGFARRISLSQSRFKGKLDKFRPHLRREVGFIWILVFWNL